jgi:hypothetical protein
MGLEVFQLEVCTGRNFGISPGPGPKIICATRPRSEHYLCYQGQVRTLYVLPGPGSNIVCTTRPRSEHYVLPMPGPNIVCTTRPRSEHCMYYQAQVRTLSVLPGPGPNIICATRPRPVQISSSSTLYECSFLSSIFPPCFILLLLLLLLLLCLIRTITLLFFFIQPYDALQRPG